MKNEIKQEQSQEMKQTMSPELSFKIMKMGQLVFEIEDEYFHILGRETQQRVKMISQLLRELKDEMSGSTGERMMRWREEIRRDTAMGFFND